MKKAEQSFFETSGQYNWFLLLLLFNRQLHLVACLHACMFCQNVMLPLFST